MQKFEKRTRRFCSTDCYDTWWNEQRSQRVTRSEVAEKIWGPAPSVHLTDVQAAWLAGLIDGEGCISIWRERREGNRSGFRYYAMVHIANTNRGLLDAIAKVIPGEVYLKDARKKLANHKPLFMFAVSRRALSPVLTRIAPFLVIKKRQAEIAMQFRRVIEEAPMRTFQDHEVLGQLWAENRALNKRGVN
jgi:hypothetical protein